MDDGCSGSCVTSIARPHGVRNCTRDYEGCPFEAGSQVLAASHRKLLRTKAAVRKRRDKIPAGKVERGRKRTVDEVTKAV
jgi:hypothetical protein